MVNYQRILDISLPKGQSAWLWGPRKTGKTTYLKARFPESAVFDLLATDLFLDLEKRPALFRELVLALPDVKKQLPIVLDEVQKVPLLLDEIQFLIEHHKLQFLLCGSSARKLKAGHGNLLGGRAWRYELMPLVFPEIFDFDLLKALSNGLIPSHYLSTDPLRSLQAYTADYLNEEIRAEGLTRNLPAFSKFLEAAGFSAGELVNYSNIARDVGVDSKTIKEYFQILVDTFIGYLIQPYTSSKGRSTINATPKFYFFDVGVGNHLAKRKILNLKGTDAGRAFENYILMEIHAYISYRNLDLPITFWRTKTKLEVDLVVGQRAPTGIEIKLSDRIDKNDMKGVLAFAQDSDAKKLIIVCNERAKRQVTADGHVVHIEPWKDFLNDLWADGVF